jgi:2-polyprenyl-6-methoxyphenol hydroxylase-like FAD-dependent oxidoreductase
MLGIFPLEHETYLFYYLPTSDFEGLKQRSLDAFKVSLTSLAPELDAPLKEVTSWQDFLHMSPVQVRVNSWVGDRVALLGDAVHALEPSLGQGANLSLQDVIALLDTLDHCFSKADFSSKALKTYEESRREHTELIQQMAEYASTYMNTDSSVMCWLRDRALKKTRGDPSLMLLGLEMASGMRQQLGLVEKLKLAGVL